MGQSIWIPRLGTFFHLTSAAVLSVWRTIRMLIETPTCSTLVLVTEGPSLEFQKRSLPLGGKDKSVPPGHL